MTKNATSANNGFTTAFAVRKWAEFEEELQLKSDKFNLSVTTVFCKKEDAEAVYSFDVSQKQRVFYGKIN